MKPKIDLKRSAPTILALLGAVGVASTAVLTAKATLQAAKRLNTERCNYPDEPLTKKDTAKLVWTYYIPPLIMGTSTIVCILGANVLTRHQQASIASAYALINSSYRDYKNKVREIYGEEAHQKFIDEIMIEKSSDVYISAENLCSKTSLNFGECCDEEIHTFYDTFSKRYFESTLAQVLEAEYHLNRNWVLGVDICINDFYDFLGISHIDSGDVLQWFWSDGLGWIDFNHHKTILEDGMEVYIIDMEWPPRIANYEYDC